MTHGIKCPSSIRFTSIRRSRRWYLRNKISMYGYLVKRAPSVRLNINHFEQMGNWELSRVAPTEPLSDDMRDRIFSAYQMATQLEPENYKAWHSWAMVRCFMLEISRHYHGMGWGRRCYRIQHKNTCGQQL